MFTQPSLLFQNPGEIDIRGAYVAGLSAKEGERPIGQFGTGLKYGIAWVLAKGGSVVIYSGLRKYEFQLEQINFRSKDFQQIIMLHDGERTPLGFTTHYGSHWQAWQIFREFYANALDEQGDVALRSSSNAGPQPGQTVICINCPELAVEYPGRDKIILPKQQSYDHDSPEGSIIDRRSDFFYYRGVRVMSCQSILTYNVQETMQLTEDRTLTVSYAAAQRIAMLLQACTNSALIRKALQAGDSFIEHDASFPDWRETSPEFIEVAAELYRADPHRHKRLYEVLSRYKPAATIRPEHKLSRMQELMLGKAKRLVQQMNVGNLDEVEIIVCDLGQSTLGQFKDGKVLLDPKVFEQGTKQVVSTLYEEMFHRQTGLTDCSYAMQTALFNLIVSLHEEHVFGEPC